MNMNMANPFQILLLEDQELVRLGFRALLRENFPAAQIHEASCYEQAIDILSRNKTDFALLDFYLDEFKQKTCMDILFYIRDNQLDTRAVILSAGDSGGYLSPQLFEQCQDAGAMGYISKVKDGESVLRAALEAVFRGEIFKQECMGSTMEVIPIPEESEAINKILNNDSRKREVLFYVCKAYSNQVIANIMGIEEGTVRKNYVSSLLRDFGVTNRRELMYKVSLLKIVVPTPGTQSTLK